MNKKIIAVLLTLTMLFTLSACGMGTDFDPNVQTEATTTTAEPTTAANIGDTIDPNYFAMRGYELCVLFGQTSFKKPEDIGVSALAQFAMCHVFYTNLVDMPREGISLRLASEEKVRTQFEYVFGPDLAIDLTKADIFNEGRNEFEMWEPLYGQDLTVSATSEKAAGGAYEVSGDFFRDEDKTEFVASVKVTLRIYDGNFYVQSAELTQ